MHSDRFTTAIPLLANPEDIDPSCLITDITKISQAKDLKLSEKGEAVKGFTAAGGNHRTAALQSVVERLENKITQLKGKIDKLKEKSSTSKTKYKLGVLKEEIKVCKAKKAGLAKWTVILYNESKSTVINEG